MGVWKYLIVLLNLHFPDNKFFETPYWSFYTLFYEVPLLVHVSCMCHKYFLPVCRLSVFLVVLFDN